MIITDANRFVADIHDRMPVLLDERDLLVETPRIVILFELIGRSVGNGVTLLLGHHLLEAVHDLAHRIVAKAIANRRASPRGPHAAN